MPGYVPFQFAGLAGRVAGSAQGSLFCWDTTAPAGFKDSSRAQNLLLTNVTGALFENTTPSDAINTTQNSPLLALGGTAWTTFGAGASYPVQMGLQLVPSPGNSSGLVYGMVRLMYKPANTSTWASSSFSITTSGVVDCGLIRAIGQIMSTVTSIGNGGATSHTPGFSFKNTTAATSGTPVQESPAAIWEGTVWNTTPTAARDVVQMACKLLPVSGTAPTATMLWGYRRTAGTGTPAGNFATSMSLTSAGMVSPTTGVGFPAMTVAAPITAEAVGQVAYCSNGDAGGKCLCMWDGANWLRIVLGAAIASS